MWSRFHFQGSLRSPIVGRAQRLVAHGRRAGDLGEAVTGRERRWVWRYRASGVRKPSTAERKGGVTLESGSGQLTRTGWSRLWEPSPLSAPGLPRALSYVEEAPGESGFSAWFPSRWFGCTQLEVSYTPPESSGHGV